jgi:hypothetical protein
MNRYEDRYGRGDPRGDARRDGIGIATNGGAANADAANSDRRTKNANRAIRFIPAIMDFRRAITQAAPGETRNGNRIRRIRMDAIPGKNVRAASGVSARRPVTDNASRTT